MKRYLLIIGFDETSAIRKDISVMLRFENLISCNALSTRHLIATGIKWVWTFETELDIDSIMMTILIHVKEDPVFKDLKMTSMEYFEIKTNKVIL